MKKNNFSYAWCVLALLTACQSRIAPKQAAAPSPAPSAIGTQTSDSSKVGDDDKKTDAEKEAAKKEAAQNYQFKAVEVTISGGGERHYIIAPSSDEAGEFIIQMVSYRFKDNNSAIAVGSTSGKVYAAISDLFAGKLKFEENKPNPDPKVMSGTWSKIDLTPVEGPILKDQAAADDATRSARGAIDLFIDHSLTETHAELRPTAATCETINLAGKWESDLVVGTGTLKVISIINANGGSADAQLFKGTDTANGKSVDMSYKYVPSNCVLEKTTAGQETRLFKIIFVGGASRQLVKIAPCSDQSCSDVDTVRGYTEMAILKRIN